MADRSLGPKRLHPAWIALTLIRTVRAFALPLVVLVVSGGRDQERFVYLVAGGLAILGLAARAASCGCARA